MKSNEVIKFLILRTVGNFLVLFAIFGILATFGPAIYYEVNYQIIKARGVKFVVSDTANAPILPQVNNNQPQNTPNVQNSTGVDSFANVLLGAKEQVLAPKDTEFSIIIPKIGASAKIFPNIDPSNDEEFLPILKQGVAHAKGTVFPGILGNTYLFAHSTDNFWDVGRYNAVFYLLKDLQPGDDIIIFFQNKRYNYIVSESKIVDSNDVSSLVDAQNTNKEELILQTCWPPGTTWQRLLILASPK